MAVIRTEMQLHGRVDAEEHLSYLHYFLSNLSEFRTEVSILYQLQIDRLKVLRQGSGTEGA